MISLRRIIAVNIFLFVLSTFACAQKNVLSGDAPVLESGPIPVATKYFKAPFSIRRNTLDSPQIRRIVVDLDLTYFDPTNLKEIFTSLAAEFPEPQNLRIVIETTPVENGVGNTGLGSTRKNAGIRGHQAFFYRMRDEMFFLYSAQENPEKLRKVVIRKNPPS